jgi:hypothetical protein
MRVKSRMVQDEIVNWSRGLTFKYPTETVQKWVGERIEEVSASIAERLRMISKSLGDDGSKVTADEMIGAVNRSRETGLDQFDVDDDRVSPSAAMALGHAHALLIEQATIEALVFIRTSIVTDTTVTIPVQLLHKLSLPYDATETSEEYVPRRSPRRRRREEPEPRAVFTVDDLLGKK